jgi:hypothetical protein
VKVPDLTSASERHCLPLGVSSLLRLCYALVTRHHSHSSLAHRLLCVARRRTCALRMRWRNEMQRCVTPPWFCKVWSLRSTQRSHSAECLRRVWRVGHSSRVRCCRLSGLPERRKITPGSRQRCWRRMSRKRRPGSSANPKYFLALWRSC